LQNGLFTTLEKGFVLTIRKTPFVEKRIGLVAAVDLDEYDYAVGARPLIRATEGTLKERIPPRLKIRKDAVMEFPHVMILIDDEKREIIEDLYNRRNTFKKIYSFTLNAGGGELEGYFIPESEPVLEKFNNLLNEKRLTEKYGFNDKFLMAVGDGNHSLATAKAHWDNVKKDLKEGETHPAKYALAEIVNIYDEGIYFEPIYRFINGIDREKFKKALLAESGITCVYYDGEEIVKNGAELPESIEKTDQFIKKFIDEFGGEVDYVHGKENVEKLVKQDENSVAILFDKLEKGDLFRFVSNNGALPRKTFSMGEGVEKRYYLEGRKIR
ncbi:MAG: DUF1015 family protein, partial [Clostridia bacterium]|nr:DUF1015 family protein [Clostridia bacterium]